MAQLRDVLMTQARSFDAIFTEMAGRALDSMARWPREACSYARLALRAQTKCQAALQAAVKIERQRVARAHERRPSPFHDGEVRVRLCSPQCQGGAPCRETEPPPRPCVEP